MFSDTKYSVFFQSRGWNRWIVVGKIRRRLLKPNSYGSCKLYKGVKLLKLRFLSVVVKSKENMAIL